MNGNALAVLSFIAKADLNWSVDIGDVVAARQFGPMPTFFDRYCGMLE